MSKKLKILNLLIFSSLCLCSCSNSFITIAYPENNQTFSIIDNEVSSYIDAMKEASKTLNNQYVFDKNAGGNISIRNYSSAITDHSKFKQIPVVFSTNISSRQFVVYLSEDKDLSNYVRVTSEEKIIYLNNLLSNKTYYYKICDENEQTSSSINNFITSEGVRLIDAGDVLNVRDIGGRLTKNGKRVKQGIIYRGSELVKNPFTVDGNYHGTTFNYKAQKVLHEDLKIKHEVDFRLDEEAQNMSNSLIGNDVSYIRKTFMPYDGIFNKPQKELVKDAFNAVIKATEKEPLYFHCQAGADRTGTMGFLINGLLGVSYTELLIDYELTSFSRNTRLRNQTETYMRFPQLVDGFIESSYNTNNNDISTCIYNYLNIGLGIEKTSLDDFIKMMLE